MSRNRQPEERIENCYGLLIEWCQLTGTDSPRDDGYWQLPGNPYDFLMPETGLSRTTIQYVLENLGDRYRHERDGQTHTWWLKPSVTAATEDSVSAHEPTVQERLTTLVGQANTALSMLGTALSEISALVGEAVKDNLELHELRDKVARYERAHAALNAEFSEESA
jgi:hypothetical protein